MTNRSRSLSRVRRVLSYAAAIVAVFVLLGVWVSHQFPGLSRGPKTSSELLAGLFKAPVEITADMAKSTLRRVKKDAMVLFVRSLEAPDGTKSRVTALIQGDQYDQVTSPFIYYLYDLYGAPARDGDDAVADLAYAEVAEPARESGAAKGNWVQHSVAVRRHAGNALRLFDAIFLRKKPNAQGDVAVPDRYDSAAYTEIKNVVRELASEFFGPPSDAHGRDQSEYVAMLEETLRDDEKLSEFVEFFTDLLREMSDSWLQSFVLREQRKQARMEWVEERMRQNRYYEIADYARAQAERRLAIHVAVDGLQGKLLEGLVELSSGQRDGSGARYVVELVQQHQLPVMDPARYESSMPVALGRHITELADQAPHQPEYLENFKKYFFSPDAPAVVVNVATVDTPTISVRNLPIIFSGHGVAGPHGTGIPNFSYLDRETGRGWYFWGSDILHMRNVFGNREHLIPRGRRREGPGARTLMERLWRLNTVSAMATVDTGAVEKISSEVGIAVGELRRDFIEKVLIQKFRERAAMERDLNDRRRWLIDHRNVSDGLLASLVTRSVTLATFREHARFIAEHEDEGLPDYLLWYNPWPDHFAHGKGPYSDEIIGPTGEYDRLDFFLGKMMEVYESVPTISGPGANYAERALCGVVSDHGLVYTPKLVSTDQALFEAMRAEGIEIQYLKLTHDEGGMPAIHGRHHFRKTRPYDAVVGSTAGGSYIIDLFGTTAVDGEEEAWRRHPGYHELRNLKLLSGQTIDFIDHLKRHLKDTMDLALVREYASNSSTQEWPAAADLERGLSIESVVRIVTSNRGDARIYRIANSDENSAQNMLYRYEVLGDVDPLDLVGEVREFLIPPGGLEVQDVRDSLRQCVQSRAGQSDSTWQELLSFTLRPDVIYQFSHLYDSERAGTVNVFPVAHVGMNSGVPGRHAGEAFGEKNGAQLYRGAGLKRATISTARNGSLPVTLFHWLVGDRGYEAAAPPESSAAKDQFGYRSLLYDPAFSTIR